MVTESNNCASNCFEKTKDKKQIKTDLLKTLKIILLNFCKIFRRF